MKKILLGILLLFISFGGYSQRAAEFKNGITIQKEEVLASKFVSYGESYINNWRDLVLDLYATYFPNNGGYEIGRLHQAETKTSLHFIPAAVGEGVIYSIGKNRTNDLDVSNSASTYVDEDGIIQTAAIDFARIDYTDGDGAFLFEDASTNLIERSETFDHASAYWTLDGVTLTSGFSAPDGSTNAYKLVEDTSTGNHFISKTSISSILIGDDATISVFVKNAGRKYAVIESFDPTDTSYFNTETGVWDNVDGLHTASVVELANGWYKIGITYNADGNNNARFQLFTSDNSSSTSYTGDGTSGIYIFGADLKEDLGSSYIKSDSGSSTTRLADVITDAGDSNSFNSISGSFKVTIRALSNDLSVRTISINDGTANNAITIGYNNVSNTILAEYIISGSPVASLSYQVSDITDYYDVEFQYALNDFKLLIDDVERDTDVSGAVLSADTLDSLDYHNGAGSNSFFGKQKQLIIQK